MEHSLSSSEILTLYKKGKSFQQILQQLVESGIDEQLAKSTVEQVRNGYYERQRKIGLPLLLIGGILCMAGLACNFFFSSHETAFYVSLYGLAGCGSLIGFAGLVYLLG
ncbi:MAG: hypothetical protein KF872_07325 [Chitinophagales bacterium]|nr:hypothetical protein [Chitinophagales bacterium]